MKNKLMLRTKEKNSLVEKLRASEHKFKLLLKASLKDQVIIQKFNHSLILQQENDRKEISRELHDEISQILTSINFDLAILTKISLNSEEKLRNKIEETHKLIIKSVEIIHDFSKKLRPIVLDNLGLLAAIKNLISDYSKCTNVKILLKTSLKINTLDDLQKIVIFRVLQESIANAIKHALIKKIIITITIRKFHDTFKISVTDNGKVKVLKNLLEVQMKNFKGIGLIGMRERAKLIQGELSVISKPGLGTNVLLTFPYLKK